MAPSTYDLLSLAIRKNSVKLAQKVLENPKALVKDENWTDYILLIQALLRGCPEIAKLLLANNCRVKMRTKDIDIGFYYTPLYYAVRLGDIKIVSLLLHKGAVLNETDHREAAIDLAMKKKHYEIAKLLLCKYFCSEQTDVLKLVNNCEDQDMIAEYYIDYLLGNQFIRNNLREQGILLKYIEFNHFWYKKEFLLNFAIINQLKDLIVFLLRHGTSVTTKDANGLTPLHVAFKIFMDNKVKGSSYYQLADTVDLILKAHNEVTENCVDNYGLSHFHIACYRSQLNVIKTFLESGVNVNSKVSLESKYCAGYTPLHCAVDHSLCSSCIDVVKILLNHKADIYAQDGKGHTPLTKLVYSLYVKKYLLWNEVMADLILSDNSNNSENFVTTNGLTHFHAACCRYDENVIKRFIEKGVDINCAVPMSSEFWPGYTPLHCAVIFESLSNVKLLLQHGADISATDAEGSTALHFAFINRDKYLHTEEYHDKLIDLFLSLLNEKSFDIVNKYGLSLLHIACTRKNPDLVNILIKNGADVNRKVSSESKVLPGYTPLHCAVKYNRLTVVKVLLEYNADFKAINVKGKNPLELACHFSYNKIYELINDETFIFEEDLIENQTIGNVALHQLWQANRQAQLDIIDLLADHEYDNYIKNKYAKQPLFESYENINYQEKIYLFLRGKSSFLTDHIITLVHEEFLIRRNEIIFNFFKTIKIDLRDERGYSILHVLASSIYDDEYMCETACDLLSSEVFDIDARNNTGLTPLHLAVKNGYNRRQLISLFLVFHADVNCTEPQNNWTPLHFSCSHYLQNQLQFRKIMNELAVDYRARVNVKDKTGKTPLFIACTTSHNAIYEILKYGADVNIVDKEGKTVVQYIKYNAENIPSNSTYLKYKYITEHIAIIKVIGLFVSKKVEDDCLELRKEYSFPGIQHFENNNVKNCEKEINMLKNAMIGSNTSLYNVIFKDPNQMLVWVNNYEAIIKPILCANDLKKKFPIYGYLLQVQYSEGYGRKYLLKSSKDFLSFLIGAYMPNLCLMNILKYFSNCELKELLENSKHFCNK